VKPRHTWEEAVVRWLLETKHKATHESDKAKLRWLHPYLGGKHLDEIDRTLVDRIKFEREKISSAGTANRYLALIRSILRRASGEWEWIDRVPKFNLFREAEGRVRSLSPQEFQRLRLELPEHLADMALFSVATGLRQANVKNLEWQYVDLDRMHLWVPGSQHKNGKPHSVPLNEMAMSVLRRLRGRHATRVFTFRGEPISPSSRSAPWLGGRRWSGRASRISAGTTFGTPLRPGTARPALRPMSYSGSAAGRPAPWWSATRTWLPRPCRGRPLDWMR